MLFPVYTHRCHIRRRKNDLHTDAVDDYISQVKLHLISCYQHITPTKLWSKDADPSVTLRQLSNNFTEKKKVDSEKKRDQKKRYTLFAALRRPRLYHCGQSTTKPGNCFHKTGARYFFGLPPCDHIASVLSLLLPFVVDDEFKAGTEKWI